MENMDLKKYKIMVTLGQEDFAIYLDLTDTQAQKWRNEGYNLELSSGCLVKDFQNRFRNRVGPAVRNLITDSRFPYSFHLKFIGMMCAEKLGKTKTTRECMQMVKGRHTLEGKLNWDTYQLECIAGALKYLFSQKFADKFLEDILEPGSDMNRLQETYRVMYQEHTRFLKDIKTDGIEGLFNTKMDEVINVITKLN